MLLCRWSPRPVAALSAVTLVALLLSGCAAPAAEELRDAGDADRLLDVYSTKAESLAAIVADLRPGALASPEDAVRWYAVAQFTRRTELLRAVTTARLQEEILAGYHAPSFGQSSPWVYRAEIGEIRQEGDRTLATVRFGMATSIGPEGDRTEVLVVIRDGDRYRIDRIEAR